MSNPVRGRGMTRRAAITSLVALGVVTVVALGLTGWFLLDASAAPSPSDPDTRYAAGPPIAVGANPADVEVGEGAVWVSGADDGSLTRIDPDSGQTRRIEVGGQPGQIAVGEGAVWIRNLGDRITRVDPATGAVSAPIATGNGAISGMTVGGGYVWLSHRDEGTVTRVDATTLAVAGPPVRVGREPRAMEFDNGTVYVLNTADDDGSLGRIDAATGVYRGSVPVGESLGGVEVDDGTVYVASNSQVVPVPEATLVPGEPFRFDDWSYFEVNRSTMWVVYDDGPSVRRIDVFTRRSIGDEVRGVGAEIGRSRFGFDRLWMTDPATNTVVALTAQG